jgi:hypothetical protein
MHEITLNLEDDIVSVCDRLEWVRGEQRVLLVLPDEEPILDQWLDLVRLRRHAERLRLEVGLVTVHGGVAADARALGFPTFTSVESAQGGRRGWWRVRRGWHRPTRPGATVQLGDSGSLKSLPDEADRREMYKRMTPRPSWARWLRRYLGILLFFVTLAIVFVSVAYAVPGATIVLYPDVERLQAGTQIVADPHLEAVDFGGAAVPARRLVVTEEWQAEVATTGAVDVPDAPARGTVVFMNRLDEAVTVPEGTRVRTSNGQPVSYQTLAPVEVPGVEGGTAEAEVVALEAGPQGNVGVDRVNRIEGSLALQLEVRNLEAIEGGAVRAVPAVSTEDQERLRAQVLQQLQTLATSEMQALLVDDEFLAQDSVHIVEIYEETYSHFPGERTERLALEIRAQIQGTAVDATLANDLVYEVLAGSVRPGYELVPESLRFRSDEVLAVDDQGRVTFLMAGEGIMAASLQAEEAVERVAGQRLGVAAAYLHEQLPLRDYPSIRVWPNWFDRMPYLPARIQTQVVAGE